MTPAAVHASPTVKPLKTRALRGVVIGLAAAGLMAFTGALGTGQAPALTRLAYWVAVILPGSLLGLGVTTLVQGWGRLSQRRWLEAALVALLVSIPHTFLVIVASAIVFGVGTITPAAVLQFWSVVLVMSLAITAITYLAAGSANPAVHAVPTPGPVPAPPAEAPPAAAPAEPPAMLPAMPEPLAQRLPLRLRNGRLVAIEAEDHYLRIHTDLGHDLVLMRMADACRMLAGVPGARVHRSWWVARAAVTARTTEQGRMQLNLVTGLEAPVSRTMQPVLRTEGW